MRRLTFTFDNGPSPGATEAVLDFLEERSIRATFFLVGAQLADDKAKRLAELAHSQGHWIGNHTFSHSTPLGLDGGRERVEHEIGTTQDCLGDLAHRRKFFRPNGGGTTGPHLLSREAVDYLQENKFTLVTWNSVPGDWKQPHEDWLPKAIEDLDKQDWTVIVLHDQYIAPMIDLLSRFHDELVRRDIAVVQDFPPACVPIEMGTVRRDLSDIAALAPAAYGDEYPRPAARCEP